MAKSPKWGYKKALPKALLLAVVMSAAIIAYAAGTCDTEDFYPSNYYIDKVYDSINNIDTIISFYLWSKRSQYFQQGYYLSFDYYRTVSCTDGTDKDVYDYIVKGTSFTNLPQPTREDVEEWRPCSWDPFSWICCISPRSCNEEVELGTKSPHLIELNKWYYIYADFTVKSRDYYAMRIEPEVEPATTITLPPREEWCLLFCRETMSGKSGW
ncbi:MAG: hypothetical protein ACK4SY_05545 [Pyrobaculum sp.]